MGKKLQFALVSLCTFLMGCSSSDDAGPGSKEVIHIKGDPMTFIEGTIADRTSGIPLSYAEKNQDLALSLFVIAVQPQRQIESLEEVKQVDQAPPVELGDHELSLYSWKNESGQIEDVGPYDWVLSPKDETGLKLYFEQESSALKFVAIRWFRDDQIHTLPSRIEHYSSLDSGEAFSTLVSLANSNRPQTLANFNFYPVQGKSLFRRVVDESFNYLFGPGVAVSWKRPPNLVLCGFRSRNLQGEFQTAVEGWQDVLDERLDMSYRVARQSCRPFSDLNTQAIYLVPEWRVYHDDRYRRYGFYVGHTDKEKSMFLDGDIFFPEKEWVKGSRFNSFDEIKNIESQGTRDAFRWVMIHELGHFLGLHHMFDEETPSIMSYDTSVRTIQDYDRKAAQELYPIKVQANLVEDSQ